MQHLTEEQLVLHHYHDGDAPAEAEAHLAECAECREQFDGIRRVLAIVSEMPTPERSAAYGDEVWTSLRWKLGARNRRSRGWQAALAAAAMIAVAFIAGVLWHGRHVTPTKPQTASAQPAAQHAPADGSRLLLVVVSDHLDNSERMLTELANADTSRGLDVSSESKRAGELVASNRIYRQAATRHGDARLATLLADLEPILVELAHAGKTLTPAEVASLQKRIESKGLLFKVRVVSAQNGGGEQPPARQGTTSL